MSDKRIKFRSAMGGYNKDDVNSYIEMLSNRYYNDELDFKKNIAALERKIEELEKKLSENDVSEFEKLRTKCEQSDRLIVELNGKLESLNDEIDGLNKENAELRSGIAECGKINEVDSEIYEKSSKYDQVSEQIGSMLVSATARAEGIVSEAELKARVMSKSMIDSTLEKLKEINEKYSNEIITKAVQISEGLTVLSMTAESFRTSTKTAIEKDCLELKEALESSKRVIVEENNE